VNQKAERMAYDAGRASVRITWPDDDSVTDEQRRVGEHHCPFASGDPQREAWLRGLRDGLTEGIDDTERDKLLKRIDEEVGS